MNKHTRPVPELFGHNQPEPELKTRVGTALLASVVTMHSYTHVGP